MRFQCNRRVRLLAYLLIVTFGLILLSAIHKISFAGDSDSGASSQVNMRLGDV